MVNAAKQEQAGNSWGELDDPYLIRQNESAGNMMLLDAISGENPNDHRLKEVFEELEGTLAPEVEELVRLHLKSYRRGLASVGSFCFEAVHRGRIEKHLLHGRSMAHAKRMHEALFIGAMLLLFRPNWPEYDAYKRRWNELFCHRDFQLH